MILHQKNARPVSHKEKCGRKIEVLEEELETSKRQQRDISWSDGERKSETYDAVQEISSRNLKSVLIGIYVSADMCTTVNTLEK